ncbi:MAG: hypothetical protein HOV79_08170 [Hamadaea sp.]|nr:hypothetical protein [Hamadaea sp.]
MVQRFAVALTVRVQELLAPERRDRGEGPVPYIILVALIGAVAVGVWVALDQIVDGWIDAVPDAP